MDSGRGSKLNKTVSSPQLMPQTSPVKNVKKNPSSSTPRITKDTLRKNKERRRMTCTWNSELTHGTFLY